MRLIKTLSKTLITLLLTATAMTAEAKQLPPNDPCNETPNTCQIYVVTYIYYACAETPKKAAQFAAKHLRSEGALTQPLAFTVFEGRRPSPVTIMPPTPYNNQGGQ